MSIYDIAVAGAGPAGTMAAIRAGQLNKSVALLERNDRIGRKILITGKGRCNVTNTAPLDDFLSRFGKDGAFFRTAFSKLSNEDLIDFFKVKGLELKAERQGRVFPITDNAMSIVETLKVYLSENNVDIRYNARIKKVRQEGGIFSIDLTEGGTVEAKKVILAMGGASYKATGSSGDGFVIAKELGHAITVLRPGLVPLRTEETWTKEVQGLTLKNIRLTFTYGKKKIVSEIGELLFTHFGVSGPLILDLSAYITGLLEEYPRIGLFIDLKPGLEPKQIENKILAEIRLLGKKEIKNFLKLFLPVNLIPIFARLANLDPDKKANQITQEGRRAMIATFKAMPLTIVGSLPIEEAMVTCGGVTKAEINPRTMESKIVPGLYFAGEIIDGSASSGGYNLQQAFSTGYLAGEAAANA